MKLTTKNNQPNTITTTITNCSLFIIGFRRLMSQK